MEKKYNDRRPRNDRGNGAKRYPEGRGYGDRRDRYRDNANDDREAFDMNTESEDEGVVVGRNAVRELLKSGRDIDKVKETGLTPIYSDGTMYFEEARLVIILKKIYLDDIKPQNFLDKEIDEKWYNDDYHTMFYGEVLKVLTK